MTIRKKLHLIFGCFFICDTTHLISAVTFNCRDGDNFLMENEDLSEEFAAMTDAYEFNKTGNTQTEPIDLITVYDYTSLTGRNYIRIKEICETDFQYDLCAVTTKTKHFDVIDDLPVLREINELNKPVCFPKTCTDDLVAIVDPNPANCNSENGDGSCEIISYETVCPERNITTEFATATMCSLDLVPEDNALFTRLNLLEATILSSCATVVAGGSSNTCSLKYGNFKVETEVDFSKGRDTVTAYSDYEFSCLSSGGEICDTTMTSNYKLPNGMVGELFLSENYVEFPFCISLDCIKQEDKEDIVVEHFRKYTADSFIAPPCTQNQCNVTLKSITCNGGMPSAAPALSTPQPSISREPTQTLSPVKQRTKTKPPVDRYSGGDSSTALTFVNRRGLSLLLLIFVSSSLLW